MSYFHDTVYSNVYQAVISASVEVLKYSEGVAAKCHFFLIWNKYKNIENVTYIQYNSNWILFWHYFILYGWIFFLCVCLHVCACACIYSISVFVCFYILTRYPANLKSVKIKAVVPNYSFYLYHSMQVQ